MSRESRTKVRNSGPARAEYRKTAFKCNFFRAVGISKRGSAMPIGELRAELPDCTRHSRESRIESENPVQERCHN